MYPNESIPQTTTKRTTSPEGILITLIGAIMEISTRNVFTVIRFSFEVNNVNSREYANPESLMYEQKDKFSVAKSKKPLITKSILDKKGEWGDLPKLH